MKISVSTQKKWAISPYMNMQFMEPLSATDSSVDAGWDYVHDCWRPELIDLVKSLAPGMVRWGGCFASYYHWKEAVGPQSRRKPMLNLCWDGVYSNAVGTAEIVAFCRRTGADPLLVFNMESDGRMWWAHPKAGEDRFGTAEEAAAWVRYCNDPDDRLRISHGYKEPFGVKWWQIGNETSYEPGYGLDKAGEVTARFAAAAHEADPSLRLIAWGDSGWAPKMCEMVGEDVDCIAFHHHFGSGLPDSQLFGTEYRKDPARTWAHMMHAHHSLAEKISEMRAQVEPYHKKLAMTEGHFALKGRNRCEVLSSWMAGAAYARCHNVLMRNTDILEIATLADFFGNRWQVNAILIPTPARSGKPYLQPVGQVMRLFGRHCGEYLADVRAEDGVDAVASVSDGKAYLHLVNTRLDRSVPLEIELDRSAATNFTVHVITPEDPAQEITELCAGCFEPRTETVTEGRYSLPPASVAVIEIDRESGKRR